MSRKFILFYISATGMYTNSSSKRTSWLDSTSPDLIVSHHHIFNTSMPGPACSHIRSKGMYNKLKYYNHFNY